MINVLEIGFDNFIGKDLNRSTLHKERRAKCSLYVDSYNLILYSPYINSRSKIDYENNNTTIYYISGNKLFSFFRIVKIANNIIKQKKINIISCIDPFSFGLIGFLLKIRYNIALNIQLHFDYFSKYFWEDSSIFNKFFSLSLAKIILKGSDSIRVVSSPQKDVLKAKGLNNKLIEIIPTPVDLSQLDNSKIDTNLCKQYFLTPKTKLLLFIGRLTEQKDLTILLKAFKLVKEEYKDVRLLLLGSGDSETRLKSISKDLGVDKDVLFLGSINNDLVFSYYYGCDIFVISSKLEGRGTVLTEAALSNKPIVATRFTGTQDSIVDGKTGFVVDIKDYKTFANKVLLLLNNPTMMKEFGKNGFEYVSKKIETISSIKTLVELWEKTVKSSIKN